MQYDPELQFLKFRVGYFTPLDQGAKRYYFNIHLLEKKGDKPPIVFNIGFDAKGPKLLIPNKNINYVLMQVLKPKFL